MNRSRNSSLQRRLRTPAITAIVIYKCIVATLLLSTAAALLLLLENHRVLVDFSNAYFLPERAGPINWLIEELLNLKPRTIEYSSLGIGFYGCVNALEAAGLWYQKAWADWLVVVLTGITLPAEIFELFSQFSGLKLLIFVINLAVFCYLLYHTRRSSPI